jgi:LuxR family maltose regulon positive regulatory protein
MVETLLATKLLLPTSRGDLVSRQHLFDMLEQSLTRKLTVVSAPAGFGKTTLIGEWIIKQEISAAWLSLDNRVWYLDAILRRAHHGRQ